MMEHEETFDLNILDVDDLNFDVDRPAWDYLIEKIIEGNVIPVIGPDLLMEGCNIHRKIIDVLDAQETRKMIYDIIEPHNALISIVIPPHITPPVVPSAPPM